MKQKFRSDALEAAHEAASVLFRAGTINKQTMRDFDQSCRTDQSKGSDDLALFIASPNDLEAAEDIFVVINGFS